jgi:glutaconate CoA-transferase, subunit A
MLGGPEVDVLLGMKKVRSLHFAYVGFDRFGLAPNFRRARESGAVRAVEYSEGTFISALQAAGQRVPFMPTRRGLGTALLTMENSPFRIFDCPLTGEKLVAVPALVPDLAIIHVNLADREGNGIIYGDPFVDPLLARAAKTVILTADRVVDQVPTGQPASRSLLISRMWVQGVCEAPGGARFTELYPDYTADAPGIVEYLAKASDQSWLSEFVARTQAHT